MVTDCLQHITSVLKDLPICYQTRFKVFVLVQNILSPEYLKEHLTRMPQINPWIRERTVSGPSRPETQVPSVQWVQLYGTYGSTMQKAPWMIQHRSPVCVHPCPNAWILWILKYSLYASIKYTMHNVSFRWFFPELFQPKAHSVATFAHHATIGLLLRGNIWGQIQVKRTHIILAPI